MQTPSSRLRASVALCRRRLARVWTVRLGRILAIGAAVTAFALAAAIARGDRGLAELLHGAVRWMTWLGLGPLALSLAGGIALRDRREGIELFAALRGVPPSELAVARVIAALIVATATLSLPALALGIGLAALGGGVRLLGEALAVGGYGLVAAATVVLLAQACARIGRTRGRAVFALAVVGPWILSELASRPGWSLPGALDALLELGVRASAAGGVA